MNTVLRPGAPAPESPHQTLLAAVQACEHALSPDRSLDARIAIAVFPTLAELPVLNDGVWQNVDGSRVRALRYSSSWSAATTLVPPGCWIDEYEDRVIVAGPDGEWLGNHPIRPLALCLAAMRARIAEEAG